MPAGAVYELAILLSLKDAASRGLDRYEDRLRATGKEGKRLLQTVQDLRKEVSQGMGQAGVGVVTLAMLKKGVDAAAEYETAILDLKSAYQESAVAGSLSTNAQANQLNRLELLAVRLGNRLQGTTQDYVGILTSLKQAGIETEIVLGGAGEAASNLANVSGALMRGMARDQAKGLGQFGKLFGLKGEDFIPSVDLFSALKDRFDIDSMELIESAKYFKTTASTLGMTGLPGASEVSKFFALIKRYGALEGTQAGTSATSFFQQLTVHADKLAKLKKETGIDVQLFDVKGSFKGWENAFKEMEKFRALTGQKRLEALNEIFGEQGGKVAGVMVEAGAAGWKNVTAEASKAVPVNEKINQQMATYNAKWEAMKGTLTNLTATVFMPMLDILKPILDLTNSFFGALQDLAKTQPGLAKLLTTTAGMIGVLLTITGGIKVASAAWGLYRMASAAALGGADAQAGGLVRRLTSLPKTIQIGLVLGAAWGTLQSILEMLAAQQDKSDRERGLGAAGREEVKALRNLQKSYASEGQPVPGDIYASHAKSTLGKIDVEKTLEQSLRGGAGQWFKTLFQNPFAPEKYPFYALTPSAQTDTVKRRAPELEIPEMMTALRKELQAKGLTSEERAPFEKVLEKAFPASFQKSTEMLEQNVLKLATGFDPVVRLFLEMAPPLKETADGMLKMPKPLNDLTIGYQRSAIAAEQFSIRLNALELNAPPAPASAFGPTQGSSPGVSPFSPFTLPLPKPPFKLTSALSNEAEHGGPAATKFSPPAPPIYSVQLTSALSNADRRAGGEQGVPSLLPLASPIAPPKPLPLTSSPSSLNLSATLRNAAARGDVHIGDIHINVAAGSPAAEDPKALAALITDELAKVVTPESFADHLWQNSREIERITVQRYDRGSERA